MLGAAGRRLYSAPLAPFTLGTQVGVPTGTSLTTTSGGNVLVGTADATETLTLTHPITGVQEVRESVPVWRRRRWTSTPVFTPASGATWLFDECEFDVPLDNWCAEVVDTNATNNIMQPLCVFRRCTFDGNSSTGRALLAGYTWVIDSHLANCEDGMQGGYYSVVIGSNLIAGDDGQADPHSDGFQCAGIGRTVLYRSWCSAGTGPGASQAIRFGTEFSAVTDVKIYYCGIDRGGWSLQFRGDAGAGAGITDVTVVGCRWQDNAGFGPVDTENTTGFTWVDNKYADGTVINSP